MDAQTQTRPIKQIQRLNPVEQRFAPLFGFLLLTSACALASFAFACATPFAAFAVIAAAMLPLTSALAVVGAAWCVNQAIGFGALHYPIDASTLAWGLAIGAGAFIATMAAAVTLRALRATAGAVAFGTAFLVAYVAYEVALRLVASVLGGSENFTNEIVGRLGVLNLIWVVGLLGVCEASRFVAVGLRAKRGARLVR